MEIFATIMIIASVVLPILTALAVVGFLALTAYSWIVDLRTEKVVEPEPEPTAVSTAPAKTQTRTAASAA
jgi:hypothetical protein